MFQRGMTECFLGFDIKKAKYTDTEYFVCDRTPNTVLRCIFFKATHIYNTLKYFLFSFLL